MSLFGDIIDIIVDVGSDIIGFAGDNLGPIIQGGATIASTLIARDANKEAAEAQAAALEAQAQAIREGNAEAAARFAEQAAQTEIGVSHLRSVVANPEQLTPLQRQRLDEARQRTVTGLAGSGLSGSGRAKFEAVRGVESDFFNRINEQNIGRGDRAASQLARANFDTTRQAANIDRDPTAPGLEARADTQGAESDLANKLLTGQAIGDIAGIIAADRKGRESRRPRRRPEDEEERQKL